MFATKEAAFSSSLTLYSLVQCTPDLSSFDCNKCLQGAIANLPTYILVVRNISVLQGTSRTVTVTNTNTGASCSSTSERRATTTMTTS
ncbi:cysteine-rich receptor-like protein kinase 25 [Quercus suber]|uniref:Cysteine-rich receptor-like protein kinase 25 n=1 Tax=Quercus suber TaxID=58331 RepID=A0AAW0KKY5_QUESU